MSELTPVGKFPHLFWYFDGCSVNYAIKNSSKKKIRNRWKLKKKYLINFLALIKSFAEIDELQMNVKYLDLYAYRFLKEGDGFVTVYKIFKNAKTIRLGSYPIGKLDFIEWDLMSLIFTLDLDLPRSDIFGEVVRWKQAKYCVLCKKLIRCDTDTDDLTDWQKAAEVEEVSLHLECLNILPVCVKCMFHYSKMRTLFRAVDKLIKILKEE